MKLINYFKDTRGEMKHVSWPNRQQTISFTLIVIIFAVAIGLLLGLFDLIFSYVLKAFIL